jgi:sugar lactone lactonase YvrE
MPRNRSIEVKGWRGQGKLLLSAAACWSFLAAAPLLAQGHEPEASYSSLPEAAPVYIGEIRNARDVTGKGSWFKRALRALAGVEETERGMILPNGVHIDARGRILVADTRARVVHVFDPARKRYQALHPPASDPFLAPIAVSTDGLGRIYATDAVRSRVFVFSPQGKFLRTIGAIDKRESIFQRATGLAIDPQRERMYVVDTMRMCVVILSLDGKVLDRIGKRGTGPGEFNYPTYIALAADGGFWVADSLNFRVQHFNADGKFVSSFGRAGVAAGGFQISKGVAVDAQGRIYVVEGNKDRVQIYAPDGRFDGAFGRTGSGEAEFFLPTGIAVGDNGTIAVADSYNGRVEIFRAPQETRAPSGGR